MPERKLSGLKTFSNRSYSPNALAWPSPVFIRTMFDGIAPDYDRFNAWASLGLHHRWRRDLVSRVPAGVRVLDLATGTGDVALECASQGHEVCGVDFSDGMLMQAREKDVRRQIRWVKGSADRLPFSDRSFGAVTSAFVLRNIRHCLDAAFRENYRVLQKGGRALHLDFGRPQPGFFGWAYRAHMHFGLSLIGQITCGRRWPKQYLESSIQQFDDPVQVRARLADAGFSRVSNTPMLWGVVQLYEGTKV